MLHIRPITQTDYAAWLPLWEGYNAFYGRSGPTALDARVTQQTWTRFFETTEAVYAQVAELNGQVVGLVHYLYHRSTSRLGDVCYLQDLFTAENARGQGVARALIEAVYSAAREAACSRVYWTTYSDNHRARALYDQVAEHKGAIVYNHELHLP